MSNLDPKVVLGEFVRHYDSYRDVLPTDWHWRDFRPIEIACKGDGSLLVDYHALSTLQRLRDAMQLALVLNSAYRTPEYNKKIGGEPGSQHLLGKAFDIALTPLFSQRRLVAMAQHAGFTGIGLYDTFVHVDVGPTRTWDNRTQGS